MVAGLRLARLDTRILKLRELTRLDLSNNDISSLPDNWDLLTGLAELNLNSNRLTTLPRAFCVGSLARSLRQLDLGSNKIVFLPNYVCNLRQLVCLKLDTNQLKLLPPSLGKLSSLKQLSAAGNHLQLLPGSVSRLRLDTLELSANDFNSEQAAGRVVRDRLEPVVSLLELAARQTVLRDISVSPEEVTPQLLQYLDSGICKEKKDRKLERKNDSLRHLRDAVPVRDAGLEQRGDGAGPDGSLPHLHSVLRRRPRPGLHRGFSLLYKVSRSLHEQSIRFLMYSKFI